jgi:hypothetical protein
MISFVALFALMQKQQNDVYDEMTQLSALDSTINTYSSAEHAIQALLNRTWSASLGSDAVTIYAKVPVNIPTSGIQHFMDFMAEKSRFKINSTMDFSEMRVSPYDISSKYSSNSVVIEPQNTTTSLGKLRGYSVVIYWDGSTKPITSSLSSSSTGINLDIYLYATKGQTLREIHATVDPQQNSVVNLWLYPTLNQTTGGKTVNITISSPGKLTLSYDSGAAFDLQENITLVHNDSLKVNYKKAELLVNNTEFGVSKQGEVGT